MNEIKILAILLLAIAVTSCGGGSGTSSPEPGIPADPRSGSTPVVESSSLSLSAATGTDSTTLARGESTSVSVKAIAGADLARFDNGISLVTNGPFRIATSDTQQERNYTITAHADAKPGTYYIVALGLQAGKPTEYAKPLRVEVPTPEISRVEFNSSRLFLQSVGSTAVLAVSAFDMSGKRVALKPGALAFATSSSRVVRVSSSGTVEALSPGQAFVTVTVGGLSGTAVVVVEGN